MTGEIWTRRRWAAVLAAALPAGAAQQKTPPAGEPKTEPGPADEVARAVEDSQFDPAFRFVP